jgi:hypothetical protein
MKGGNHNKRSGVLSEIVTRGNKAQGPPQYYYDVQYKCAIVVARSGTGQLRVMISLPCPYCLVANLVLQREFEIRVQ